MIMEAYMKVYKSIKSADYIHLKNGSVMNLINNFNNIYNSETRYKELIFDFDQKLKMFEENKNDK